jgi:purine-binding chemotaxis protein CheW
MVASAGRICALPMAHVRETMRPLPVERFPGAPEFVLGLSMIRGANVPVVDLALLLGAEQPERSARRYVTLKSGERDVALSVADVLGVRALESSSLSRLPPLVDSARSDMIEALGTLDAQLLRVLRAASVLSEAAWAALSASKASP